MVNIYRFALFGLSGSGKTCYLAALDATTSREHPEGYVCKRIRHNDQYPKEINQNLSQKEKQKKEDRLAKGDDTINTAIADLCKAQLPKATRDKISLIYHLSAPGLGNQYVEIDDYSGELLELPEDHTKAKEIREEIANCQGIIVMIETPLSSTNINVYERLNQAISILLQDMKLVGKFNIPIILLFSKWDRYRKLDGDSILMSHEKKYLDQFLSDYKDKHLANYSSIKELIHKLSNSVIPLDQKKELAFNMMPISSFGSSKIVNTSNILDLEIPVKTNPLPTFGLQDPFVWLIQTKNKVDIQSQTIKNKLKETILTAEIKEKNEQIIKRAKEIIHLNPLDTKKLQEDLDRLIDSYQGLKNRTFLQKTIKLHIPLLLLFCFTLFLSYFYINTNIKKEHIQNLITQDGFIDYELIKNDDIWLKNYIENKEIWNNIGYFIPKNTLYTDIDAIKDRDELSKKVDVYKKCNEHISLHQTLLCYDFIRNNEEAKKKYDFQSSLITELNYFYDRNQCDEIISRFKKIDQNQELLNYFIDKQKNIESLINLCEKKQNYISIENQDPNGIKKYLDLYKNEAQLTPYYQQLKILHGFQTKNCEMLKEINATIKINKINYQSLVRNEVYTNTKINIQKDYNLIMKKDFPFKMINKNITIPLDINQRINLNENINISIQIIEDNWISADITFFDRKEKISCGQFITKMNHRILNSEMNIYDQQGTLSMDYQIYLDTFIDTMPIWEIESPLNNKD